LQSLRQIIAVSRKTWKSKQEFEKAEIVLKQSQEIFEYEKDLPALAKVMNTLGGVLERQQKWDEAEKILRQSYDLALKLEDKLGQAIIANSLGQVIANKKGEESFELSLMYFRQSIKLGEELNEQQHLAKAHTAMGQAFLAHEVFEQAVDELSKGFEIDESLGNVRGLKIVTPNLTYALSKLGKREEALEYCDRVLKIAPNYPGFLQLRDKIQLAISTGIQQTFIKTGLILYIRYNQKDNSRWGRILPDDGSPNITFNENFIGSESISKLIQGALVEVDVKEKSGKLYAKQIRLLEEEES
jgi:tetratricopeptide (TPR) repeat protein